MIYPTRLKLISTKFSPHGNDKISIDALSKKLLPKLEVNLLATRNADASVSQINDSADQLAAAEPIPAEELEQ